MIGLYLILVRKAISTEKRDVNTDMSYERSARMESSGKETFVIATFIMNRFLRNKVDVGHTPPIFREKFDISEPCFSACT